jgi:hypothetical protein
MSGWSRFLLTNERKLGERLQHQIPKNFKDFILRNHEPWKTSKITMQGMARGRVDE